MIIKVTHKSNNSTTNWKIGDYDDVYNFCKLYKLHLHLDIEKDLQEAVQEELNKIDHPKYYFNITQEEEKSLKPNNYFELHLFILQNINHIHYYNKDVIDNDLLGKILISNCNKDYRCTEYLLHHLTYSWFTKSVAKKVYELLSKSYNISAKEYANKLLNCSYWGINEDS